jgi:hypothetical protein
LAYAILPFVLAYNWTLISHFLLTGLIMLIFLRHFGFPEWQSVLLAVTYQFSTAFILNIGHPSVVATCAYYPLLWLAWDNWLARRGLIWLAAAGVTLALIFYTGNLQSDVYPIVFGTAFLFGYAGLKKDVWKQGLVGVGASFLIGLCLAAPVVLNQVEVFLVGARKVGGTFNPFGYLGAFASLSAIYPWAFGTFRTLDLSKLAGQIYHFGFIIYIGSAGIFLAVLGAGTRQEPASRSHLLIRTALWLVGLYLVLISTPLVNFIYLRCSGLAVMALIVLAAFGLQSAIEHREWHRTAGRSLVRILVVCAILTNFFPWLVYPTFVPRIKGKAQHYKVERLGDAQALRTFQIENLPAEISFRNPEAVLASLSLLLLSALLLRQPWRARPSLWVTLLIVNALPVLLYGHRFVPRQPISVWQNLLAGGPEQQRMSSLLRDKPLRLYESDPSITDQVFPNAMSHLYHVRTVHGYAGLYPTNLVLLPESIKQTVKPQLADLIYATEKGGAGGELTTNATPGLARFQWMSNLSRPFRIDEHWLNRIAIHFDPGEPGVLLWSDSFYPGWTARLDGRKVELRKHDPCFSTVQIPGGGQDLILQYSPRFLPLGCCLTAVGSLSLLGLFIRERSRPVNGRPLPHIRASVSVRSCRASFFQSTESLGFH